MVGTSKGKLIPFLLIDAPFSLVVDTVFFPSNINTPAIYDLRVVQPKAL
ncbi:YceK/YidQ family lipoprotein [Pseudomonas sp. SDT291_1_S447]